MHTCKIHFSILHCFLVVARNEKTKIKVQLQKIITYTNLHIIFYAYYFSLTRECYLICLPSACKYIQLLLFLSFHVKKLMQCFAYFRQVHFVKQNQLRYSMKTCFAQIMCFSDCSLESFKNYKYQASNVNLNEKRLLDLE